MVDTAMEASGTADSRRDRISIGNLLERSAVPLFLLALIILFTTNPTTGEAFSSTANIQNILANQSVTGLIALGMIVPLVAGYFDLSVAAIAGLSNVTMTALLATHGQSVPVAIFAGVAVGVVAGAVNAVLIAGIRLNPFISTLGTYILIGGLLQFYTGGQFISYGMSAEVAVWGSGTFLGLARPFWMLIIVGLILWWMLMRTPFGRKLAAIGSNETAARLAGIRVERAVFISFLISGLLGGMAGVLLTIRTGGGDSTLAAGYLFPAFAAVFLGHTAINPGYFNVWGTVVGVFLVAVAANGFILMGADAWVTQVFNGSALLIAVSVSTLLARARDRRAKAVQRQSLHIGNKADGPAGEAGLDTKAGAPGGAKATST